MNYLLKWSIILFSFFSWINFALANPATYLDLDPAARPSGMGSAFTALADDGNATLFNPAGLTNMGTNQLEATGSYGFLTQGRFHNSLSVSQQLPPNSYIGYDLIEYGVGQIIGADIDGFPTSNFTDLELAFRCSYAYELDYNFKVGITASFLYENVDNVKAPGFGGVDIGFLFVPSTMYDLTFGASIRHLGGFLTWDAGYTEYLTPDLRVGVSEKLFDQTLILSYDAESLMQSNLTIINHGGAELGLAKFLAIRAGIDDQNPTFGVSLKFSGCNLDYSFALESDGLGNTHRVGADLFF